MKIKTKSILVCAAFFISSCTNLELDLQDNPNQITPEKAELEFLFNSIQIDFADAMWEAYDETAGISRMMAMTGGNSYDNNDTPSNFNFLWTETYANLLPDIDAVLAVTNGKLGTDFPRGVAKTLRAYSLMTLVDVFGDIPYTDALLGASSQNPTLDDDATVYLTAISQLEEAKNHFQKAIDNNEAISLTDIFYNGDASQWLKAINSLIIRAHVTTKLAGGSGAVIALIAAEAITNPVDDFDFKYGSNRVNPDARQPYYSTDYEGTVDYYQSNYFMWSLLAEKGIEDPRLRYYFYRQDCNILDEDFALDCPTIPRPLHYTGAYPWCVADYQLGYWGRDHGNDDGIPADGLKRTTFGVYPVGGLFDADQCSGISGDGTDGELGAGLLPIISAATTYFLRAEAALTMNSGEDARDLLEKGIRSSIDKVMTFGADQAIAANMEPTVSDINTYTNIVLNLYDTAGNDEERLNVIMKEYHIAAFGNGLDAYNNYRRTGMPRDMQPTRDPNSGTFPRLMFYPSDHVALNSNGSQRSIAKQVFWDTNPANPAWIK